MRRIVVSILFAGLFFRIVPSCQPSSDFTRFEKDLILEQSEVMRVLSISSVEDSLLLRGLSTDIPIEAIGKDVYRVLSAKMLSTVTSPEQNGVGIAGPQVGIFRRVVAVQRFDKEGEPFEVYPNIRIVGMRGELEYGREGCLSVPDITAEVPRYRDIDIQYTSPSTLTDTVETVLGFTAVIFQHECDHLEGILFQDRLN